MRHKQFPVGLCFDQEYERKVVFFWYNDDKEKRLG